MKVKKNFIYDPSLVLFLPLYELDGTSFMDKSHYGHLATVTGALWRPDGRSFDGDDYINCGTADILRQTGAQSMFAWIKPTSWDGTPGIMGRGSMATSNTSQGGIGLFISAGVLYLQHNDGVTSSNTASAFTLSLNTWQYVGFTWDGTTNAGGLVFYLNEVADSKTCPVASIIANPTDDDFFKLGRRSSLGGYFYGTIGEGLHHSRVLTASEAQQTRLVTKWRYV